MGVRILEGTRINEGDHRTGAVLYCSTSGVAFGPVFCDASEAQAFVDWLPSDPRWYTAEDLQAEHGRWLDERMARGDDDDEGTRLVEEPVP